MRPAGALRREMQRLAREITALDRAAAQARKDRPRRTYGDPNYRDHQVRLALLPETRTAIAALALARDVPGRTVAREILNSVAKVWHRDHAAETEFPYRYEPDPRLQSGICTFNRERVELTDLAMQDIVRSFCLAARRLLERTQVDEQALIELVRTVAAELWMEE